MKVQVKSLIAQGIFIGASSGLFYMTYRLGMGFTAPMWMAFIGFPITANANARIKDLPTYLGSMGLFFPVCICTGTQAGIIGTIDKSVIRWSWNYSDGCDSFINYDEVAE